MSKLDKFGKSIVAAVWAVVTIAIPLYTADRHIDPAEGIVIAAALVNALLVYVVPLSPSFKSLKSVIGAAIPALAVAQTVIVGGISLDDWYLIISAVLAAIGIKVFPAASTEQPQPVAVGFGPDR